MGKETCLMLKDGLVSAITHAKVLKLLRELYPMMAEMKELYCVFISSGKPKCSLREWIRQFNSWQLEN